MRWSGLLICVVLVLLSGALGVVAQDEADETPVQFIELSGHAAERDAEISSLVWVGDQLLLLTENPFIYASDGDAGKFFALEKEAIIEYLAAEEPEPLEPRPVPIYSSDIMATVSGYAVTFDGFEGAAVFEDTGYFADPMLFLTIEADTVARDDPTMRGYVVSGTIEGNLESVTLDLGNFIELPRQTDFNNMSYESLTLVGDSLMALYEVNGVNVNENPMAYMIDLANGGLSTVPLANLEYRLTDVTTPDENGMFWAINYFFVGEDFLANDADPLFAQYGMGASQAEFDGYERLVAFQITDAGIELVDQAPIQLLMTEDSNGRNWEGIARLDDMGVLIVTDKYPQTILGFVPTGG